jgi:hypothetical protein
MDRKWSACLCPATRYQHLAECVLSTTGALTSHHHSFRSHCSLGTRLRVWIDTWYAYPRCVCLLRRLIMSVAELGRAQELLNSCICTRQVAGDQLVINQSSQIKLPCSGTALALEPQSSASWAYRLASFYLRIPTTCERSSSPGGP